MSLSCLGLYLISSSLAYRVFFILCSILFLRCFIFCLSFFFSLIFHLSCILSLFISSFLSLLPLDSFVYSWQNGREYTKEYIGLYRHFYMTHVHILKERNSNSLFDQENIALFVLRFVCFFVLLYGALSYISIYVSLLSLHRVCVLDMHTSLYYCVLLVACSDDNLLCYMIIVVIFI